MHKLKPEIRDQLPSFTRFKPQEVIVKDQAYLNVPSSNGFSWNNKNRITPKFYPYYHEYRDRANSQIESNIQREIEDKKEGERARIARLAHDHKETFNQLHDRIQERKLLQIKSRQALINNKEPLTAEGIDRMTQPYLKSLSKKVIMAKHSVHTDNKWNFLLENDQKRSELLVTPVSVKGEEQLIQKVKKKLEEEKQFKDIAAETFVDFRKNVRQVFKKRHQTNLKLTQKNDAQSEDQGSQIAKSSIRNNSQNDLNRGIEISDCAYSSQTFRSKLPTPNPTPSRSNTARFIETPTSENQRIAKLALPKQKDFIPKNDIERHEFKGLLIKHCNEGLSEKVNPFVSILTSKSPVFSQMNRTSRRSESNLNDYSRGSFSLGFQNSNNEKLLPGSINASINEARLAQHKGLLRSTSHRSTGNIHDPQDALAELDKFDYKYRKETQYRGYPGILYDVIAHAQKGNLKDIKHKQE